MGSLSTNKELDVVPEGGGIMETLFEAAIKNMEKQVVNIADELSSMPLEVQVDALNRIRAILHESGPFAQEPVDLVVWKKNDQVEGNDYNPNKVAPPEMRLLERSIQEDGYTQPIVGWPVQDGIIVVDGFHRTRVGKESKTVRQRVHGYLPIAQIRSVQADEKNRMAATIRHNRARGVHAVSPMQNIVASLLRRGWHDDEIAKELGMDADEVLRYKQTSGVAHLYRDVPYSKAWE